MPPMFLCRIFITPGGAGEVYREIMAHSLQELANAFPDFQASVNAPNHFVEFEDVHRDGVKRMEAFLKTQGHDYTVVIEEQSTDSELLRSQYLPLCVDGDSIDTDRDGNPLNVYRKVKCQACLLAEEDAVPDPYVVAEDNVRRIQDIYSGENGILIVSEKFMLASGNRLADCVRSGDVVLTESSRPRRLKGPYFWLRPLYSLGSESGTEMLQFCKVCGEPTQVRKTETGDKFLDAQIVVKRSGTGEYGIALSENWYGKRTRERPMSVVRHVYISSEMYFFLQRQKLKGIVRPSNVLTVCT